MQMGMRLNKVGCEFTLAGPAEEGDERRARLARPPIPDALTYFEKPIALAKFLSRRWRL
jgi:hypothetical protein